MIIAIGADAWVNMYLGMCVDTRVGVRVDMCVGMSVDMWVEKGAESIICRKSVDRYLASKGALRLQNTNCDPKGCIGVWQ